MRTFGCSEELVNAIVAEMGGKTDSITEAILKIAAFIAPERCKHPDRVLVDAMTQLLVDVGFEPNVKLLVMKVISIMDKVGK